MTQASDVYARAALTPSREPNFELIQQPKPTFDYWAVRLTIHFALFIAASPTLFTLFLTLDLLNLLEEDLPPTGPLSSDNAVNALQPTSVYRQTQIGWQKAFICWLRLNRSILIGGLYSILPSIRYSKLPFFSLPLSNLDVLWLNATVALLLPSSTVGAFFLPHLHVFFAQSTSHGRVTDIRQHCLM